MSMRRVQDQRKTSWLSTLETQTIHEKVVCHGEESSSRSIGEQQQNDEKGADIVSGYLGRHYSRHNLPLGSGTGKVSGNEI